MPSLPIKNLLVLLAGGLLLCANTLAGDETGAESRARTHIDRFPGHSLHAADHGYGRRDVVFDRDGSEHVRFDRTFRGMKVIGGDLVVHSDRQGLFSGVSQTLNRPIDVPSAPRVSLIEARQAALAGHPRHVDSGRAETVVYARGDRPVLAWDIGIQGALADGTPSRKHVIVDALSGRVLDAWDEIHTATKTTKTTKTTTSATHSTAIGSGTGFLNGPIASLPTDRTTTTTTVTTTTTTTTTGKPPVVTTSSATTTSLSHRLLDPTRGSQYTVDMFGGLVGGSIPVDSDNVWGNGLMTDRASVAVDAQYGTAVTWDYYLLVHGRSGIANNGVGASNRVHFYVNYSNAYWDPSCFCMYYGDGDGITFNPFVSLDVAGHEMSHGVTSSTANLTYSGESGGLNEATSDIFGTAVEFYANNSKDPGDYLIGERLFKTAGLSIRSMIQPSSDGLSADCWYATVGTLDVHYSSGIANHFFYLLSEGSGPTAWTAAGSKTCNPSDTRIATGPTVKGSPALPAVAGIGRAKAEKIWYRALTAYMTANTNYSGARVATIKAANDLAGVLPQGNALATASADAAAVAAAWDAVLVK